MRTIRVVVPKNLTEDTEIVLDFGGADASPSATEKPQVSERSVFDGTVNSAAAAWKRDLEARGVRNIDRMMAHVERVTAGISATRLDHVTTDLVRSWLTNRRLDPKRPISAKTHDNYLSSLRRFGEFCEDAGWVRSSPIRPIRGMLRHGTHQRQERGAFTIDEVRALIDAATQDERSDSPRHRCRRSGVYALMFWCGLRRSEVARLRVSDIQTRGDAQVRLRATTTKNAKPAILPIADEALGYVRGHLDWCRGDLFAEPFPCDGVLLGDMRTAMIPRVDDQKRSRRWHALRAGLATYLANANMPPHVVQQMLRHSDMRMTFDHYVKSQPADLKLVTAVFTRTGAEKTGRIETNALTSSGGMPEDEGVLHGPGNLGRGPQNGPGGNRTPQGPVSESPNRVSGHPGGEIPPAISTTPAIRAAHGTHTPRPESAGRGAFSDASPRPEASDRAVRLAAIEALYRLAAGREEPIE